MKEKNLILFALFALIACSVNAQVSGKVTDQANGKPISKATVFVNNTSIWGTTSESGEFQLQGIAPGFAELVIYREGYQMFKSAIRIHPDKAFKLNLPLTAAASKEKPGKVKQDEEYRKNMEWFTSALLGSGPNAARCTVENPKAISLTRQDAILKASFFEPVVIRNQDLGYQITCYLQDFESDFQKPKIEGAFRFDTLSTKDYDIRQAWDRNRLKTYWGSSRHFFAALQAGSASREGFELLNEQGIRLKTDSLVSAGKLPGYFKVKLLAKTKVIYRIEDGTTGVKKSDEGGQVSWVIPKDNIEVTIDGHLLNKKSIENEGVWAQSRLADMLPDNYVPTATLQDEQLDWQNFALLREKIYLHTDRDYYYPREYIWFKAYLGYSMRSLRDTLSKTLYVDLISPDKKVIQSKVLPIAKGASWAEFRLPESSQPGEYYLRAYTNWLRNYGDSAFFVKAIPVLEVAQNVAVNTMATKATQSDEYQVKIEANQPQFDQRQRVELKVAVKDAAGNLVPANLSVSVVDDYASVPLENASILSPGALKVKSEIKAEKYFDEITHMMERGVTMRGEVKDDKGLPVAATLEVIQGDLFNMVTIETDDAGKFTLADLFHQDTMAFAVKAKTKKGRVLKNVKVAPPEVLPFIYEVAPRTLAYRKDNAMQRIQNSYLPDEQTILLDEVTVTGKRVEEQKKTQNAKVYGDADYTVSGENLRATVAGSNLLVALQGRVPGLQVTETKDAGGFPVIQVRIRGGSSSLTGSTEPLILVDGVPFPDVQSLSAIDPAMVDRIEVLTRAVPQFGSRGTNGVIAIYLKQGASFSKPSPPDFVSLKVKGYDKPKAFPSPDYGASKADAAPDFRTTLYWRPQLITDPTGVVSFYTSDVVGKFRITVEGVTEDGKPVRGVSEIIVD